MRIAVVAIGNEVTEGRVVNSNAALISRRLLALGHETAIHLAVRDDAAEMMRGLRDAAAVADMVFATGGLGPTADDLTRDVAAAAAGVPLIEDEEYVAKLEAFFRRLGREMSPNNRRQAQLPRGATTIPNRFGTAPGFRMELFGKECVFLPGVPRELDGMLSEEVIPDLERRRPAERAPRTRRLVCFGLPESRVDAAVTPLFSGERRVADGIEPGYNLAEPGVVHILLNVRGLPRVEADERLERAAAAVRGALGTAIFGEGDATVERTVAALLLERGLTVAFAESCTAGLATATLARVPGISASLKGGVVAYANEAKRALLGVPESVIAEHGAVSAECALAMARGARLAFGADVGAATTGVAGPSGGTPEKPVGLVYVAVAIKRGSREDGEEIVDERVRTFRLAGERTWLQQLWALVALDQVRRAVLGHSTE